MPREECKTFRQQNDYSHADHRREFEITIGDKKNQSRITLLPPDCNPQQAFDNFLDSMAALMRNSATMVKRTIAQSPSADLTVRIRLKLTKSGNDQPMKWEAAGWRRTQQ